MDDDDLQKIRQARMQELAQQGQGQGGSDKKQQEDEARKSIISQILTPEAVDRLGRIAMVKESRARHLESRLIMMARSNQIRQRVTEEDLIALINAIDEKKTTEQKVVFSRRKGAFDDDDDLDF
ncbi:DNA-binding TFAR19-related protein [Choiromyces venosus 120613-1]|uniref:DNA-binding TFAR19-related protein n=1 Tax=Choiromyces venosus 120613-1 TaxID=1336337 RepID=A0A3N4JZ91_9PEZI|nr:DNA-binding TFAR19-related protein [Choiromyces venosus 120613-1]